jgi:STE24 endopeptidase
VRLSRIACSTSLLCLLFSALCAASGRAARVAPQSAPAAQTTQPANAQSPAAAPPAQSAGKKETSGYTLSPDKYQKAVAYSRSLYMLYFVSFGYGVLVLLLILKLGIATRYRDFAEGLTDRRWLQALVFVPLLILTIAVARLPTSIYGHSLSLRYEQSVQGWGSWFWDWTKFELILVILSALFVIILFAVIRKSPRRWWLYFWMVAYPIAILIVFGSPWIIDPLFNKFEPLDARHPNLVTAIEQVVQRAGLTIPRDRVFLMQASLKTNEINAYVTGLGASKRVVVWDTTIQKTTTPETLFIFGHEMGHYVLGHVRNGLVFFAILLFVVFFAGFHLLHWALDRWGRSWSIRGPEDWASLPLMLLLLSVIFFVCMPVVSGFSRIQEHDADVYGLEVIYGLVPDSADVAAHAFQVLGEVDLADPNPPPFIEFWLYSHPPLADRLVFARTYDPWSKGEAPKYVK